MSAPPGPATRLTKADPCFSYDYNNTVSVLVGKEEQEFTVHKDAICAKSKFFKAACSERWSGLRSSGGKQKPMKLPETSVRDFQTYVHWIYTSQIEVESEAARKKQKDYLYVYILGDVLDDYQLRNAVMEKLMSSLEMLPTQPRPTTIEHVYQHTPVGSPLRKLLIDRRINRGSRAEFIADVEQYPVEFIQELALALISKAPVVSKKDFAASVKSAFKPETGDADV